MTTASDRSLPVGVRDDVRLTEIDEELAWVEAEYERCYQVMRAAEAAQSRAQTQFKQADIWREAVRNIRRVYCLSHPASAP